MARPVRIVGVTARLSTMGYPNGQTTTNTYYGNLGDERLQEIWNQGSGGSTISKFDYTYDSEGEIQSWTQQTNSSPSTVYNFQYDAASQLIEALQSGAVVSTNEYTYDAAGNRLSEQINGALTGASYNNVNELTSQSGGGLLRFRGSINETSTVSVAGVSASLIWTNIAGTNTLFDASASVSMGTNVVPVIAQDYNGNVRTNYYQVVVTGGVTNTLTYDLNGNLTAVSNQQSVVSYRWDAANRLVAIYSNLTYSSVFSYDGLGRRVRQTEISGTTTNSDHRMLWCGTELCEERDSTGATVTKRFFREGEQISGTNYFFTRDHLGSIREMTDSSDSIRARYSYDPWGLETEISGDLAADFGFTGHYFHAPSGLHLALYRAYSADLGRWLSRDPIGETGGLNLYEYVSNDPIEFMDPLGLRVTWWGGTRDDDVPPSGRDCYNSCMQSHDLIPVVAGIWGGFSGGLAAGVVVGSPGLGLGVIAGGTIGGLVGVGTGLWATYQTASFYDQQCKSQCHHCGAGGSW